MRERAGAPQRRRDGAVAAPTICTFHALGLRILRREAAAMQLDAALFDSRSRRHRTDRRRAAWPPSDRARVRAAQWQISAWKNALVAPDRALARAATEIEAAAARESTQATARRCRAYQAVDFDDLIALPVAALERDAGAADALAEASRSTC